MKSARLRLDTGARRAIVDITGEVAAFVRPETDGLLNISVPHATAGLVALAFLLKADRAAHADDAFSRGANDEHVVLDDRFELLDAGLHETLFILGRVVFKVLGEVAKFARRLDLGDDGGPSDGYQLVELLPHAFQPFGSDMDVVCH